MQHTCEDILRPRVVKLAESSQQSLPHIRAPWPAPNRRQNRPHHHLHPQLRHHQLRHIQLRQIHLRHSQPRLYRHTTTLPPLTK
ncbi:hypothetical protein M8J77_017132 [Diaphorina citri]|nr:hypothetical protein M8J77_017132 [Diaphorina citri]